MCVRYGADMATMDEPMRLTRRAVLGGAVGGLGLWAAGCGPTSPYVPASTWATTSPTSKGWDQRRLDEALAFAGSSGTKSLVLLLDGRVLAERYFGVAANYTREVASCQKSVVALLVGVAEQRGLLRIDRCVSSILGPGWSNTSATDEGRITVRHLLTMTSGLDADLGRVATPGEQWAYNNNAYHQLQPVLEEVTGQGIDPLCRSWLWSPIGATASRWAPRPGQGGLALDPKGNRLWGLTMSARDMARFGLLVLRRGAWGTTTVLADGAYLRAALSSSSTHNPSYGYLWWLNGQDGYRVGTGNPLQPGPFVPDAPSDMVAALGKDDQKIYVSRSTGLVLVRQGDRAGTRSLDTISSFDNELWKRVLAAAP